MLAHRNLIAWYRCEGNGDDSSGNGNNLTVENSPSFISGKIGKAFDNGTTDSAASSVQRLAGSYSDFYLYNLTAGSVGGWFKSNISASDTQEGISIRCDTSTDTRIYIGRNLSSGTLFTGLGSVSLRNVTGITFSVEVWNHVFLTWTHNKSSGTALVYWNGVQVDSYSFTVNSSSNTPKIKLGGDYNGTLSNAWRGSLDEITFWGKQLSTKDVKRIMYLFHPLEV